MHFICLLDLLCLEIASCQESRQWGEIAIRQLRVCAATVSEGPEQSTYRRRFHATSRCSAFMTRPGIENDGVISYSGGPFV